MLGRAGFRPAEVLPGRCSGRPGLAEGGRGAAGRSALLPDRRNRRRHRARPTCRSPTSPASAAPGWRRAMPWPPATGRGSSGLPPQPPAQTALASRAERCFKVTAGSSTCLDEQIGDCGDGARTGCQRCRPGRFGPGPQLRRGLLQHPEPQRPHRAGAPADRPRAASPDRRRRTARKCWSARRRPTSCSVLDAKTGEKRRVVRDIIDPYQLGFSPDGKWFVTVAYRLDHVDIYPCRRLQARRPHLHRRPAEPHGVRHRFQDGVRDPAAERPVGRLRPRDPDHQVERRGRQGAGRRRSCCPTTSACSWR